MMEAMADDETTNQGLHQRISDLLTGQAALHRTIAALELDKKRLERQVEELRSAVTALLAPAPSEMRQP
jgi:phage shock protein A